MRTENLDRVDGSGELSELCGWGGNWESGQAER